MTTNCFWKTSVAVTEIDVDSSTPTFAFNAVGSDWLHRRRQAVTRISRRLSIILIHMRELRSGAVPCLLLFGPSLWVHQHKNLTSCIADTRWDSPDKISIGAFNAVLISTECTVSKWTLGGQIEEFLHSAATAGQDFISFKPENRWIYSTSVDMLHDCRSIPGMQHTRTVKPWDFNWSEVWEMTDSNGEYGNIGKRKRLELLEIAKNFADWLRIMMTGTWAAVRWLRNPITH